MNKIIPVVISIFVNVFVAKSEQLVPLSYLRVWFTSLGLLALFRSGCIQHASEQLRKQLYVTHQSRYSQFAL